MLIKKVIVRIGRSRLIVGLQVLFIMVIVMGAIFLVSVTLHRFRVENYFTFARDVSEYVNVHHELPSSVESFCRWKTNETGCLVWNIDETQNKIHFELVSISNVVNGALFITIDESKFKKYEDAINQRFVGGLPLIFFDN